MTVIGIPIVPWVNAKPISLRRCGRHRKETGIPNLDHRQSGSLQNSGFPFPSVNHSSLTPNCLFGIIRIFDRELLNFLSRLLFTAFRNLSMADNTSAAASLARAVVSPGLHGRACKACAIAKARCVPSTDSSAKCQRLLYGIFPLRLGIIQSSLIGLS
jgi:hypothetical protein